MADRLHIEGMGVIGCLLARTLDARGIDFTWSDTETDVTAWKASTGLIYPSADPEAERARALWAEWIANPLLGLGDSVEETRYLSTADKGLTVLNFGRWHVARGPAYACSVQYLVLWTRERFTEGRVADPPAGARVIVAHGFNERTARYLWGWSLAVQADRLPAGRGVYVHRHPREAGSDLSGREAYLYPIAHDPGWFWAGSEMRPQPKARPLDLGRGFDRWQRLMAEVGIETTGRDDFNGIRYGWRPVAEKGDTAYWREIDGRLVVRPMSHSGVRMAPLIVQFALDHLEIA